MLLTCRPNSNWRRASSRSNQANDEGKWDAKWVTKYVTPIGSPVKVASAVPKFLPDLGEFVLIRLSFCRWAGYGWKHGTVSTEIRLIMSKCKFLLQTVLSEVEGGVAFRSGSCVYFECDIDLECQFYDIFHFGEQKSNQSISHGEPSSPQKKKQEFHIESVGENVSPPLQMITMESHIRKLSVGKNNISIHEGTQHKYYKPGYRRRRWMEKIERKYVSGVFQFVHEVSPQHLTSVGWNWFSFFLHWLNQRCVLITFFCSPHLLGFRFHILREEMVPQLTIRYNSRVRWQGIMIFTRQKLMVNLQFVVSTHATTRANNKLTAERGSSLILSYRSAIYCLEN